MTVPAGATLKVTALTSKSGSPQNVPVGALFAFVGGTCTIAGTINSSGVNPLDGNGGGSGGGGGGSSSAFGTVGADASLFGSASSVRSAGGGAAGGPGSSGASGAVPSVATQRFVVGDVLAMGAFGGSTGGAGGGNPSAAAGRGGGGGGGVVLMVSPNYVANSGTITVNGGSGGLGSAGGAPGGPGGNGWFKQFVLQ